MILLYVLFISSQLSLDIRQKKTILIEDGFFIFMLKY